MKHNNPKNETERLENAVLEWNYYARCAAMTNWLFQNSAIDDDLIEYGKQIIRWGFNAEYAMEVILEL